MNDKQEGAQSPIRVLIVCTGNICRSPLAEQVLRLEAARYGLETQFIFESAGTRAEIGQPTNPESVKSASTRGIEPFSVIARQLTANMVADSDLILTATTDHRGDVARLVPSASRKTFTLKEFARVLEFLSAENEHLEAPELNAIRSAENTVQQISLATQYRGYAAPAVDGDDIEDPWGRASEVFDLVTDEILRHSEKMIRLLKPLMNHAG
jgi:protein-tyrosine phosphatase